MIDLGEKKPSVDTKNIRKKDDGHFIMYMQDCTTRTQRSTSLNNHD